MPILSQTLSYTNNLVHGCKVALSNATPRIQLFFVANCIKLIAFIFTGLAGFFSFHPLVLGTSISLFLWLVLMLAVALPQASMLLAAYQHWLKPAYKASLAILAVAICISVLTISTVMVWNVVRPAPLPSIASGLVDTMSNSYDSTSFSIQATENLLSGKNPYAHANIVTALDASPDAYTRLTPLRTGAFADSFPYPTPDELKSIWDVAINNPDVLPQEIETKFNYPAGSFLLLAPFMAVGISDIRIILIILLLPAVIYAAKRIAPRKRWYFVLGTLLSCELLMLILSADTKLLCIPFILAGWFTASRRPYLSAIFIGIAVATKQTAWFLLPFYLILIWKTINLRLAIRGGIIVGAVFFVTNAPFIIADYHLWLSSVFAPMVDPMFPLGDGLVTLVLTGIIPLDSPILFTVMEVATFVLCILWYMRHARRYPHTGLILSLVPIFFAWRSIMSYFCCIDTVLLASILTKEETCHEPNQVPA
ncbi:MAG: hypothetical protein FWF98_00965 [Dehalococcoidia bacterium]|nr:hypothetical protein [Dehalococcoidia bacterium]